MVLFCCTPHCIDRRLSFLFINCLLGSVCCSFPDATYSDEVKSSKGAAFAAVVAAVAASVCHTNAYRTMYLISDGNHSLWLAVDISIIKSIETPMDIHSSTVKVFVRLNNYWEAEPETWNYLCYCCTIYLHRLKWPFAIADDLHVRIVQSRKLSTIIIFDVLRKCKQHVFQASTKIA